MARTPSWWSLESHSRTPGSRSHRRRVTNGSQARGTTSSRRRPPPSRFIACRYPPSRAACSAAIARPRPLLPPVRDGSSFVNRSKMRCSRSSGTPGPRSETASTRSSPDTSSSTVTSVAPACSRALSRKLARMRSSRRGSVSTTTDGAGGSNRAVGCRDGDHRPHQPDHVDRLDRHFLRRGVEARQLHELLDERPHPPDIGHEQLGGSAALRRQLVEMVADDRRLGDERRERRPQLVRHVGDEPPVLVLGRLEAADRVRQDAGHPVEPLGPGPEFVARRDRHPRRQVAALDPLGDAPGLFHRRQDAARHGPRDHEREHDHHEGADREGQAQLVDRGIDAGDVADEVERRAAAGRSTADDERRLPRDIEPAVGELAPVDARLHVRRQQRRGGRPGARPTGTWHHRPGRRTSRPRRAGTCRRDRCARCPPGSDGRAAGAPERPPTGRSAPARPRPGAPGRAAAGPRTPTR